MSADVAMDDMDIDFTMDEDPEIARLKADAARIEAVCTSMPAQDELHHLTRG